MNYQQLQQKLASANASVSASEIHGIICGVICTGQQPAATWLDEIFDEAESGDLLVDECRQAIDRLYSQTLQAVEGAGTGMQLLLPEDNESLMDRAAGVSHWCQGYLYGIGLGGSVDQQAMSEEADEALQDIASFTRIDIAALEDPDEPEEEEGALMEITEFIWVAAMLIRESYRDLQADQQADQQSGGGHEYH